MRRISRSVRGALKARVADRRWRDLPSGRGIVTSWTVEDPMLEPGPNTPFGSIDWRAENDKEGYEWKDIPIDGETRSAIGRALEKRRRFGRMGSGPLFPRSTDPDRPITANIANRWFRLAESLEDEDLNSLEPMPKGQTFHGYRSKFATETKHLTDKDRAKFGGWKSEQTIQDAYDQVDDESMLRVITERQEVPGGGSVRKRTNTQAHAPDWSSSSFEVAKWLNRAKSDPYGAWRSPVARLLWEQYSGAGERQ